MLLALLTICLPIFIETLLISPNWNSLTGRPVVANSLVAGCETPSLQSIGLWSLCRGDRPYIQLGHCSSHFIECSRAFGGVAVRKCPYKSFVFMNGRCLPAENFPECKDRMLNQINEETKQLVESESFCANGAGIYRSQCSNAGCARQALICHPNGRDAIPVVCPAGQILTETLECAPAPQWCPITVESTTPIHQLFLQRVCEAGSVSSRRLAQLAKTQCASWYVKCQPQPSVVYCAHGEIFDDSLKNCRKWTEGDICVMAGICKKHEWQSIPLGKCESEYIFCEGSVGKLYTCGEDKVYNGRYCSPRNVFEGCTTCRKGERRPSSLCNEYYECVQSSKGLHWQLRECTPGSAFNDRQMACQPNYMCATKQTCKHGSSFSIDCSNYMYCTGEHYEMFSCPPNTRWNVFNKRCVEDPTCRTTSSKPERQCLEGYTIPSSDCITYQLCYNGKYVAANCGNISASIPVPCAHCFSRPNKYEVDQLTFPGQCSMHDRLPHPHDCTAYYACDGANWIYKRCEGPGQVFDASSKKCRSGKPWQCASYAEVQCRHGEKIVDKNSSPCDRRVIECRHGKWVDLRCPNGYVFDEMALNCVRGDCQDQQHNSGLSSLLQITDMNTVAGPPAPPPAQNLIQGVPEFVAPSCSGTMRIADQYDCARFWQCGTTGRFQSMMCPSGSIYDAVAQDCVQGQCSSMVCVENSFQPSEVCGHYKTCYHGQWVEARCNNGKQFVNGRCTKEDCVQQNFEEKHYSQLQCHTGAVRPHPSNKHSYMFCQYGMWTERSCLDGGLFDWKVLGCVVRHGETPQYVPKCYEGETRSSAKECSLYEQCVRGEWMKKACPYGHRFYNGQCIIGNCISVEPYCRESSGVDGYRRMESDCSKYYQCVHGKWLERPCAPGTVFNERLSVCDHARNVPECGGY